MEIGRAHALCDYVAAEYNPVGSMQGCQRMVQHRVENEELLTTFPPVRTVLRVGTWIYMQVHAVVG